MKHRIRAIGAAAALHCRAAAFLALSGTTLAQDKAPPTPAIAPAQSEIQKWIATTDAQWQAAFKRDVTDVREAELKKVMAQFKSSLAAAIAKVSDTGDLDGVVVLRNEQERFFDTNVFLAQDLATEAESVKQLRAATRIALTKLEKDHVARVQALHAKYDQLLAQAQAQLTKGKRIDDALEVKAKRGEIATAWLARIPAFPLAPSVPAGGGAVMLKTATKARPYVNSLGMKFVPVVGTKVLFCVWETRVQDYEAFVNATRLKWEKPGFAQGPAHPAVNVGWNDAKAFCVWLSGKEGIEYRLPTDEEWSTAVCLRGETGETPSAKNGRIADVYPWGTWWPPPKGAGNYVPSLQVDTFEKTAPVGSFEANDFGIYDLGGNVWEWCEDSYDSSKSSRVLRGGSFLDDREYLQSSSRFYDSPVLRFGRNGFRVVVAGSSSAR